MGDLREVYGRYRGGVRTDRLCVELAELLGVLDKRPRVDGEEEELAGLEAVCQQGLERRAEPLDLAQCLGERRLDLLASAARDWQATRMTRAESP